MPAALVPLREPAKLPPNATNLRAISRSSITGTFVTAKSGDKARVLVPPRSVLKERGGTIRLP